MKTRLISRTQFLSLTSVGKGVDGWLIAVQVEAHRVSASLSIHVYV